MVGSERLCKVVLVGVLDLHLATSTYVVPKSTAFSHYDEHRIV